MKRAARKHPPLKDLLNAAWEAVFGLFFASIALAAARQGADSPSWKDRMVIVVLIAAGLATFGHGVLRFVRLFRPPTRAVLKREKRIGRMIGLWIAYAVALAMFVGSVVVVLREVALPLLRNGTFRAGPLIVLPIGALGAAILLVLPDAIRRHPVRPDAASADTSPPLVPVSGLRRAAVCACLTAFPLGVGLLVLGALAAEGFPRKTIPAVFGTAFLAFGLFLARWAVPYAIRNGRRPFVRFRATPGAVEPGSGISVRCDIEPAALKGATRLLIRPFVAILMSDESTPPPLRRTPEGRRPDDATAWYGEPLLDVADPAEMASSDFVMELPDFRKFSRKKRFNPWDDSVEWRLEALLFQGGVPRRRAVFRIQIKDCVRPGSILQ